MDEGPLRVTVVWCVGPRKAIEVPLELSAGTTVEAALKAALSLPVSSGAGWTVASISAAEVGVWGRAVDAATVLKQGDRLECYRTLLVDPKLARRERFAKQGARGTGLFASRRPQAKQGY